MNDVLLILLAALCGGALARLWQCRADLGVEARHV